MPRFRTIVVSGLCLLLLAGFVLFFMSRRAQRRWASTIAETAIERAELFRERDAMGLDMDRQRALFASLHEAHESAFAFWSVAHNGPSWRAALFNGQPEILDRFRAEFEALRSRTESIDRQLAHPGVRLAEWVLREADSEVQTPSQARWTLRILAQWWFIEGLRSSDPSAALDALERIAVRPLLPREWEFHRAIHKASELRDALHLDLLMRGRLHLARLQQWQSESLDARTIAAEQVRLDRVLYQPLRLQRRILEDRAPQERVKRQPIAAIRQAFYARLRGPRDANRTIRALARGEQWLRGIEPDMQPLLRARRWAEDGGWYIQFALAGYPNRILGIFSLATHHRNARLFGVALAKRSALNAPLWPDHESFVASLGERAGELSGSKEHGLWPSHYRRMGPNRARLEIPPTIDIPAIFEPERAMITESPWNPDSEPSASVTHPGSSIEFALPSGR